MTHTEPFHEPRLSRYLCVSTCGRVVPKEAIVPREPTCAACRREEAEDLRLLKNEGVVFAEEQP